MTVKQKKKKENKQPKKIIFVCKFLLNFVPCPIKHIKFNLTFIPQSTCFCKPVNQNKDKDFFFKEKKTQTQRNLIWESSRTVQNCNILILQKSLIRAELSWKEKLLSGGLPCAVPARCMRHFPHPTQCLCCFPWGEVKVAEIDFLLESFCFQEFSFDFSCLVIPWEGVFYNEVHFWSLL